MSLDLLPADLLLKIFHQLPFKDRARLGGVNRSFRDASEESICKMKSLVVDDDLMAYLIWNQKFSCLLEFCSPTLERIEVNNRSCSKSFLNAMAEFIYPKMKHLEITVCEIDNGQMKKMISRCPNLRSIVLHLNHKMECPNDIVFEKLENLEIGIGRDCCRGNGIDLSPTFGPLIGKVPSLKYLKITSEFGGSNFTLSAQEFSQLLASTPYMEKLHLELFRTPSVNVSRDISATLPTWRLPRLTSLHIDFHVHYQNQPTILHHFPTSFPRLESLTSNARIIMSSQDLMALLQLKHLRELRLRNSAMKKAQIIDLITSVPSIIALKIWRILDVLSMETHIDFLSSTAPIFHRDLEIRVEDSRGEFEGSSWELKNILEGLKDRITVSYSEYWNDEEDMEYLWIKCIRYKSLEG